MSSEEFTASSRRAFIVRPPVQADKVLAIDEITIGWSKAEGLINEKLTKQDFREIVHKIYFPKEENKRRSGQIAGDLWRFIRDISIGNYILVPTDQGFYIGRVTGPAYYNEMRIFNDTAYRRKVEWLNQKRLVPFAKMPDDLKRKLKSIQAVVDASNVYQEIEFAMRIA